MHTVVISLQRPDKRFEKGKDKQKKNSKIQKYVSEAVSSQTVYYRGIEVTRVSLMNIITALYHVISYTYKIYNNV